MFDGLNLNSGLGGGEAPRMEQESAENGSRPELEEVIIVGSGPAGWSAAIYTARAHLRPLLITGNELGGQVAITTEVENYPGFPEGLTGPELVERMRAQAEKFGAAIEIDYVTEIDVDGPPFGVKTASGRSYRAKSLIVATGASPRKLGVPSEDRLTGRGVSYCATCDGFFFRGKELVVVGGGDSALEEALFLTKFATRIRIVHRRDQLRAGAILQRRATANPKIEFIWNTVVTSITGENKVESVTLRNLKTGAVTEQATDGVFVYVGHLPNNQLFAGKLAMDDEGYLITDKLMRTSVPGIFAGGEIQDRRFRQVATSVGQGVAAAMEAEKYIAALEDRAYPGAEQSQPLAMAKVPAQTPAQV
jgi:thioredoxin reductase (NADPH)